MRDKVREKIATALRMVPGRDREAINNVRAAMKKGALSEEEVAAAVEDEMHRVLTGEPTHTYPPAISRPFHCLPSVQAAPCAEWTCDRLQRADLRVLLCCCPPDIKAYKTQARNIFANIAAVDNTSFRLRVLTGQIPATAVATLGAGDMASAEQQEKDSQIDKDALYNGQVAQAPATEGIFQCGKCKSDIVRFTLAQVRPSPSRLRQLDPLAPALPPGAWSRLDQFLTRVLVCAFRRGPETSR